MFSRYFVLAFAFLIGSLLAEKSVGAQSCSPSNCASGGYIVYPQTCSTNVCNSQTVYGTPVSVNPTIPARQASTGQVVRETTRISSPATLSISDRPLGPALPASIRSGSETELQPPKPRADGAVSRPAPARGSWTSGNIFPQPGGC